MTAQRPSPVGAWRRLPLRARLVVLFTTLLLLALTTVGALALTMLRTSLVSEVDTQLTRAAQSLVAETLPSRLGQAANPLIPSEYAVIVSSTDGVLWQENVGPVGRPDVGDLDLDHVLERGTDPFTAPSQTGSAQWRVVVAPLTNAEKQVIGTAAVGLPLTSVNATMGKMIGALIAVGAGVLAIAGVATYAVVRSNLQPLRRIETTAAAIAAGDLTQRVETAPPSTEVGSLARSLNTMLGHLETSFAAQRASEQRMKAFVGDASHELRTPLATITGYSELYRLGGIPPEEVAGVMSRIEDSSVRMTALVADLLSLARLDQGARLTLQTAPLAPLLHDAAADLRALDPEREVTVNVPADLTATLDEDAVRRVLTNLVGNAAAYSPAGTPVEITAVPDTDGVLVSVVDHGPGVPEADRVRIFERFARLDAGRTRDAGGSGLGLSIVAALAHAMGGWVRCTQTPGGGATFDVHLPR